MTSYGLILWRRVPNNLKLSGRFRCRAWSRRREEKSKIFRRVEGSGGSTGLSVLYSTGLSYFSSEINPFESEAKQNLATVFNCFNEVLKVLDE